MIFKKGTSLGREKLAFWPESVENVTEKPDMSELPDFALPVKLRRKDGMVLVDVMDLFPVDEWHGDIVNSAEWVEAVSACRAQDMCVPIARDMLYVTPVGQLCLFVLPYREEAPGTLEDLRGNLLPMDEFDSFVAHGEERVAKQKRRKLEEGRYNFFGELEYDGEAPDADDAYDDSFVNWQMDAEAAATPDGFDTNNDAKPPVRMPSRAPVPKSVAPKPASSAANMGTSSEPDIDVASDFDKFFVIYDPAQEEQVSSPEEGDPVPQPERAFPESEQAASETGSVEPQSVSMEPSTPEVKTIETKSVPSEEESVAPQAGPTGEESDDFDSWFSVFGTLVSETESAAPETEPVVSKEGVPMPETELVAPKAGASVPETETAASPASLDAEPASTESESTDEWFGSFDDLFGPLGAFDAEKEISEMETKADQPQQDTD